MTSIVPLGGAPSTIAFQGEPGAFGEEVAIHMAAGTTTIPVATFKDVFAAVADGNVGAGVVPVENSYAGSVYEIYDLLVDFQSRLTVIGEYMLRIRHMLMALPGETIQDIHTVISHPQALAQTADFLDGLHVARVQAGNTALAAKHIVEERLHGVAAVASRRAADVYGLEIVAANIETSTENVTRFLVLGKMTPAQPRSKTSIVIATDNQPGALLRALEPLARENINLTKLESRPSRMRPWEYLFYLDFAGDIDSPEVAVALDAMTSVTTRVSVIGSYSEIL